VFRVPCRIYSAMWPHKHIYLSVFVRFRNCDAYCYAYVSVYFRTFWNMIIDFDNKNLVFWLSGTLILVLVLVWVLEQVPLLGTWLLFNQVDCLFLVSYVSMLTVASRNTCWSHFLMEISARGSCNLVHNAQVGEGCRLFFLGITIVFAHACAFSWFKHVGSAHACTCSM
jgi:hypothetical protein